MKLGSFSFATFAASILQVANSKFTTFQMAPPKLNYGLNLSKANTKKPSSSVFAGQKRKSLWDDPESEDEGQKDGESSGVEITTLGGLSPFPESNPSRTTNEAPLKKKTTSSKLGDVPSKREYTNLAALHTSKKHANEAESLDPSIYDYDGVYDSLHARSKSKSSNSNGDPASQGPKYMTALLKSADTRKRDQLRARDKLLAREREAEGDEFADKEKFVTAAYKAQQEEVKRIEAEEAEKEKEEAEKRKKGIGMVGFYRDVLKRDEQRHEEAVRSAEEAAKNKATVENDEVEQEKTATQIAEELNAKGAKIAVNDEGEVVDKRQLLTAGLNVVSKPKPAAAAASGPRVNAGARAPGAGFDRGGIRAAREMQRARQTEMITEQLEEKLRKEKEEEEARLRELAEKNKSQKSKEDVMSAKERYLARKRERERQKESSG
ncbi:Nuclear speckle splicing regulatory protein-like protein [Trichophyton interdigitale]|uniref:Nuclear speckle splicing regulatory like protein n=1 Tax=Trichophyton interdigitale TaxID=101480 RepID=A0A9P4YLB4_9EURO|nr:Nuclear speckle splicing regulatory like protein [Trichophyton interdigitale]KAF3901185.1 Nuclear speckle splicing regulatory like protein [Trichophyton interdigitale]KAG8212153.1 Nuclear speckle splicing regulatory protein-like protein [Trichophyton interdigitale]